ncbi:hypothetical protein K437DRAFT_260336 [Tilletiaria anomala UBC 951]|uniref:Zn(2)-C6 fungal-type domain-containing protein n=1 Tax=Tilletiaria anomala (strain ATCC 24038 / CBS 436.72 / UBC 951) TaxID=1037660 RepID=A0A066VAJ5_TILAU|nr:uncharacterized protein K437DRAFT_260336 [Tilletiaria anomala UBC 951]KDN35620.1 hypothetical protein K437DRAFT_260336 [Tilletiaria anomala UBC 951]
MPRSADAEDAAATAGGNAADARSRGRADADADQRANGGLGVARVAPVEEDMDAVAAAAEAAAHAAEARARGQIAPEPAAQPHTQLLHVQFVPPESASVQATASDDGIGDLAASGRGRSSNSDAFYPHLQQHIRDTVSSSSSRSNDNNNANNIDDSAADDVPVPPPTWAQQLEHQHQLEQADGHAPAELLEALQPDAARMSSPMPTNGRPKSKGKGNAKMKANARAIAADGADGSIAAAAAAAAGAADHDARVMTTTEAVANTMTDKAVVAEKSRSKSARSSRPPRHGRGRGSGSGRIGRGARKLPPDVAPTTLQHIPLATHAALAALLSAQHAAVAPVAAATFDEPEQAAEAVVAAAGSSGAGGNVLNPASILSALPIPPNATPAQRALILQQAMRARLASVGVGSGVGVRGRGSGNAPTPAASAGGGGVGEEAQGDRPVMEDTGPAPAPAPEPEPELELELEPAPSATEQAIVAAVAPAPIPGVPEADAPACDRCRLQKLKCDRAQPVCGRCARLGKADECTRVHVLMRRGPPTKMQREMMRASGLPYSTFRDRIRERREAREKAEREEREGQQAQVEGAQDPALAQQGAIAGDLLPPQEDGHGVIHAGARINSADSGADANASTIDSASASTDAPPPAPPAPAPAPTPVPDADAPFNPDNYTNLEPAAAPASGAAGTVQFDPELYAHLVQAVDFQQQQEQGQGPDVDGAQSALEIDPALQGVGEQLIAGAGAVTEADGSTTTATATNASLDSTSTSAGQEVLSHAQQLAQEHRAMQAALLSARDAPNATAAQREIATLALTFAPPVGAGGVVARGPVSRRQTKGGARTQRQPPRDDAIEALLLLRDSQGGGGQGGTGSSVAGGGGDAADDFMNIDGVENGEEADESEEAMVEAQAAASNAYVGANVNASLKRKAGDAASGAATGKKHATKSDSQGGATPNISEPFTASQQLLEEVLGDQPDFSAWALAPTSFFELIDQFATGAGSASTAAAKGKGKAKGKATGAGAAPGPGVVYDFAPLAWVRITPLAPKFIEALRASSGTHSTGAPSPAVNLQLAEYAHAQHDQRQQASSSLSSGSLSSGVMHSNSDQATFRTLFTSRDVNDVDPAAENLLIISADGSLSVRPAGLCAKSLVSLYATAWSTVAPTGAASSPVWSRMLGTTTQENTNPVWPIEVPLAEGAFAPVLAAASQICALPVVAYLLDHYCAFHYPRMPILLPATITKYWNEICSSGSGRPADWTPSQLRLRIATLLLFACAASCTIDCVWVHVKKEKEKAHAWEFGFETLFKLGWALLYPSVDAEPVDELVALSAFAECTLGVWPLQCQAHIASRQCDVLNARAAAAFAFGTGDENEPLVRRILAQVNDSAILAQCQLGLVLPFADALRPLAHVDENIQPSVHAELGQLRDIFNEVLTTAMLDGLPAAAATKLEAVQTLEAIAQSLYLKLATWAASSQAFDVVRAAPKLLDVGLAQAEQALGCRAVATYYFIVAVVAGSLKDAGARLELQHAFVQLASAARGRYGGERLRPSTDDRISAWQSQTGADSRAYRQAWLS